MLPEVTSFTESEGSQRTMTPDPKVGGQRSVIFFLSQNMLWSTLNTVSDADGSIARRAVPGRDGTVMALGPYSF